MAKPAVSQSISCSAVETASGCPLTPTLYAWLDAGDYAAKLAKSLLAAIGDEVRSVRDAWKQMTREQTSESETNVRRARRGRTRSTNDRSSRPLISRLRDRDGPPP